MMWPKNLSSGLCEELISMEMEELISMEMAVVLQIRTGVFTHCLL